MSWYRTGTISLTNGSVDVTGVGTAFSSEVRFSDILLVNGALYEIVRVLGDTTLKLSTPYLGATAAGVPFAVIRNLTNASNYELMKQIEVFLTDRQRSMDEFADWINGLPGSGANANGIFPLTDRYGVTVYCKSPKQLEADTLNLASYQESLIAQTQATLSDVQAKLTALGDQQAWADQILGYKNAAAASATKAGQWAENAENTAVETGKYSAKHHAIKAAASATAAATSKTGADTAKTAAETAKAAAETARTGAQTAEANALASKDAAALSASTASTKATDATNSATAASTSASGASASEVKAGKWAENAENTAVETGKYSAKHHALKAAASATGASGSASTATTKASEASTSATNAAASASTATTKATEASTSASNAAGSASTAATKATEASTSATTAATKATEASTSATSASTSMTKAGQWAEAAENTVVETGKYSAKHHAAKAAASASAAATSQGSASTSASTATTKAAEASTSATSAAASATSAATKATEAATSATNAANANTAAQSAKTSAEAARDEAVTAAAAVTGALVELGGVSLSAGVYPAKPDHGAFWKVTTGGVVDGIDYGVGDTLVYSRHLDQFYKIDNTESVTSVNGKAGVVTLTAADVGAVSTSGTAASATKLVTARQINGVAFDGTANITVADSTKLPLTGGTLTGSLTVSSADPQVIVHESDSNTRARLIMAGGQLYIQVGANGQGTVSSGGDILITGLNATDVGNFKVRAAGAYQDIWHSANAPDATQIEAEAGAEAARRMWSPLTIRQAIAAATAGSANQLATARTINGTSFNGTANITTANWGASRTLSFTGDATGSSTVNGSANVATALTLSNTGVAAGTYLKVTVDAKGRVTAGSSMAASDVPNLDASKITSGTISDDRLASRLGWMAATVTDWNSATSNGWYMASNGLNAPVANVWFLGNVENHGAAGWCTQTVHAFSSDSEQDTNSWRRDRNNGTWGSWYRLRLSEAEQSAIYLNASNLNAGTVPDARLPSTMSGKGFSTPITVNSTFDVNGSGPGAQQNGIYVADLGGTQGTTLNPTYTTALCWQQSSSRSNALSIDSNGYLWGFRSHSNAGTYTFQSKVKEADEASSLKTARTINGVAFDGTANITIADSTKLALAGGTATGTINAPTFNATSTTNGGFQGIDADTATAPSFTWSGDLDTGMWRAGVDAIGFTCAGVNRITINTTGISGNGSQLTSLNASNISSGTIPAARVPTLNQSTTGNAATATTLTGLTATVAELNYVDGVTSAIQTQLNTKAALSSPIFTGDPRAPTAAASDNDTTIATTAHVKSAIALFGLSNSSTQQAWHTGNLVKQASTSERTAGAVMVTGAFGLGDVALSAGGVTSWNNFPAANGRWTAQNLTDAPKGADADWFIVDQYVHDANHMMQVAVAITGPNINRMYRRVKTGGVWNPWREFYMESNVVGNTISPSEGAIIEQGSNANGQYTRFADGTQICRVNSVYNNITIPGGGLSGGHTWNFPAPFASADWVGSVTNRSGWVYDYLASYEGTSATGMHSIFIKNWSSTSRTQSHVLNLIAIGRWY